MNKQLQKELRERRNALIPEALGLRFGCELYHPEWGTTQVYEKVGTGNGDVYKLYCTRFGPFYSDSIQDASIRDNVSGLRWDILGTPVTLQEILRMINKTHTELLTLNFDGAVRTAEDSACTNIKVLNLTKSPEDWDAEVLEWILEVTK